MNKLDKAKKIIKDNISSAEHGIFSNRNWCGDDMNTLYDDDDLIIDICYYWEYFEVFGLTAEEFSELEDYYEKLLNERRSQRVWG